MRYLSASNCVNILIILFAVIVISLGIYFSACFYFGKISLDDLSKYFDIVNKGVETIAVIVGGYWVYSKWIKHREDIWNLEMKVVPEYVSYNSHLALLILRVNLKNIGKVKIVPGPHGCRVSVRTAPQNVEPGQLINWEQSISVVDDIDILRRYRIDGGYPKYEIEPGCEYHEIESLVIPKGIHLVKAEFFWEDNSDSIEEYNVIHI